LRAKIKKRQRNRNLTLLAAAVIVIAVVVVSVYYFSTLTNSGSSEDGKLVPSTVYRPVYNMAVSPTYGPSNTTLVSSKYVQTYNGQAFTTGGKPVLVYVGAEYCPYCAFQRWPMVMALMRFGNFTNLKLMQSSPTDVYANTPTFSFYGSSYSSNYLIFQPYEQEDRSGAPLQTVPTNYTTPFAHYGGNYPFLDFNNKYVIEGSYFFPTLFASLNWTQVIQQIQTNTELSIQVLSSANAITALICNMTGGNPSSVCTNSAIVSLPITLVSYHPDSGPTLVVGTYDGPRNSPFATASAPRRAADF